MRFYLFGFSILFVSSGYCQLADFNILSNGCLNQQFEVINSSIGGVDAEWDFCARDLAEVPVINDATVVPGFLGGFGYKAVFDDGQYHAFVPSFAGNILFRLDFGSSLNNTPTVVNLGNPGNLLNKPQSIDVLEVDGSWYAFIGHDTPGQGVIQLNFGPTLTNFPAAKNLGDFGFPTRVYYDVRATREDAGIILVLLDRIDGALVRVRFDNLINYVAQSTDIFVTENIPEASSLFSFDLGRSGNNKIVIVTSYFNNKLLLLNYGSTLLQDPLSFSSYTSPLLEQPIRIRLVNESGRNYALVSNISTTLGLSLIDYNDFTNPPSDVQSIFPALFSVDGQRVNGETFVTGLGSSSVVKRLIFKNDCGAIPSTSNQWQPGFVSYSTQGTKHIALKVSDDIYDSEEKIVTVTSAQAPVVSIQSANSCAQHDILFQGLSSSSITNYDWNFGDSESSNDQNPVHQYATSGTYSVRLTVTGDNGCNNVAQQELVIYDKPVANFDLPSVTPLCTNQPYLFDNTSAFDPNSNPTWSWSINGLEAGTLPDLTATLPGGTGSIRLEASIPGCTSEIIRIIDNVIEGPEIDFSVSGACEDSMIEFTSTISGSINSLSWDFGDGQVSTQENPLHTYINSGTYQVTLEATNDSGCANSKVETIQIYSQPSPNFSLDLPPFSCAGSPSQFNDLTSPLPDSNLASWTWSFGDPSNSTATQQNPTHTYTAAGDYAVSLEVTSNFGCSNSVQKTVTISEPPSVDFFNDPACLSQGTRFTDASSVDVKAWLWSIQNSTYNTKNPTHTFNATGEFPVMLTVTGTNNCINQLSKPVQVPIPVAVNFDAVSTCATLPATFAELTAAGTDPAVSWSWDFNGQPGAGSPEQHTFPTVGTYPVTLSSTRASGCTYTVTKLIPIIPSPVAQFTASTEAGAAPLAVGFTNLSTNASSFMWAFNDAANTTSSEFSPSFIFNDLGTYSVQLIASNSVGCSNSFVKSIHVVVPEMNAAVTDFELVPAGDGTWRATVTVLNKSNLAISNPEIFVDLSGLTQIKERLPITLQPNQSVTQTMSSNFVVSNLQYACAEVRLAEDLYDFDNQQCANLTTESVAILPYPNPVSDELVVNWINTEYDQLSIAIYNSAGQIMLRQEYNPILPNLNQVKVDVSKLGQGIYYVSLSAGGKVSSYRVAIVR